MKLFKTHLAILALIVTNVIWGAALPIYKWSLETIEPFTFVFIRFFLAALIILPFCANRLKIEREDYGRLVALSLAGVSLNISFLFLGLQLSPSINAAILGTIGPIFLLLFAAIFLHEKLKAKTTIGTLISLVGVLFIVLQPDIDPRAGGSIIGNIFFLLSIICGITHTLLIKKITTKYNILALSFWTFLIGSMAIMPLALFETYTHGFLAHTNYQGLIGILYGAVFSSVIAYSLFSYGLKYIKANESGVFSYVDPIATIVVALPLLGEKITLTYAIGSLLVFVGIYIAELRMRHHPIHK